MKVGGGDDGWRKCPKVIGFQVSCGQGQPDNQPGSFNITIHPPVCETGMVFLFIIILLKVLARQGEKRNHNMALI